MRLWKWQAARSSEGPEPGQTFVVTKFALLPVRADDGFIYWLQKMRLAGYWHSMFDPTSGGSSWMQRHVSSVSPYAKEPT